MIAVVVLLLPMFPNMSLASNKMPPVDCVITPSATMDVSSPVPGTLAAVNVDRSDVVKKDQIIAQLNSEVEQAAVSLARAKAELNTEINIGEVNLAFDEEKSKRLEALHGAALASPQDKDDAERNRALSQEKLKHARELHKLRLLELQMAEARLNQKLIRSPIRGVVVQRYKSKSEHIEDDAIVRIAQVNPLHVEAIVPIEFFGHISARMSADVFSDSFANSPQSAVVTVVDHMGDAASGTFGVRLELANPEYKLPAGVKCRVQILPDIIRKQTDHATNNVTTEKTATDSAPKESVTTDIASTNIAKANIAKTNLAKTDSITTGKGAATTNKPATNESNNIMASASTRQALAAASAVLKNGRHSGKDSRAASNTQKCSSLGPYSTEADAQPLLDALKNKQVKYSLYEGPARTIYRVLAPDQGNLDQSRHFITRVKLAGIDDVGIIWSGEHKQRVSLGVFSSENAYKRRINQMTKLGFDSEIHELTTVPSKWWVTINLPVNAPDSTVLRESLSKLLDAKQFKPAACPSR